MKSSDLRETIGKIPQLRRFFRGIFAIDETDDIFLEEDEFVIINTE